METVNTMRSYKYILKSRPVMKVKTFLSLFVSVTVSKSYNDLLEPQKLSCITKTRGRDINYLKKIKYTYFRCLIKPRNVKIVKYEFK